jgi:chromate transporter
MGAVALHSLFLIFLKLGFVVFGSGYVLLAFLRADLVEGLGWLTNEQLLDAVAVGQFTPGPLFTTATFIGYIIAGLPGALVATLGIFLPSFLLVAALNPLISRMRRSPWLAGLLDGVNAAALGLMAGVTLVLAGDALLDPLTMALAIGALAALVRWNVNSALLVALGGAVGLIAGI